jgi:hypothetical protein
LSSTRSRAGPREAVRRGGKRSIGRILGTVWLVTVGLAAVRAEERAPPPAAIPSQRELLRRPETARRASDNPAKNWWVAPAGIGLVLLAGGALSWSARRHRGTGAADVMRIVARTPLTARHAIYLIEVKDRVLLVGVGTGGPPTLLADWTGERARTGGDS